MIARVGERKLRNLSRLLLLGAGVIAVPNFLFVMSDYEKWLVIFASPWGLIMRGLFIAGLGMAEAGVFFHYYAKTQNAREALFNTLVGFGVVIAVIVAGLILRR